MRSLRSCIFVEQCLCLWGARVPRCGFDIGRSVTEGVFVRWALWRERGCWSGLKPCPVFHYRIVFWCSLGVRVVIALSREGVGA